MFPQGTSDVCVILELSKSFLFLVTFCQLFQFTWYSCSNVQGWVSHYGVSIWSSQRVFFDHALDSSIFWGFISFFPLKHCSSCLYWIQLTIWFSNIQNISLFSKSLLRAITPKHTSFFLQYLPLLVFNLYFYLISSIWQHISWRNPFITA